MRKSSQVLLGVFFILILFVAFNSFSLTGNVSNLASSSYRGFDCWDSDGIQGENSIFTAGEVIISVQGTDLGRKSFFDKCVSETKVQEYGCRKSARAISSKISCPDNGICRNNACEKP